MYILSHFLKHFKRVCLGSFAAEYIGLFNILKNRKTLIAALTELLECYAAFYAHWILN